METERTINKVRQSWGGHTSMMTAQRQILALCTPQDSLEVTGRYALWHKQVCAMAQAGSSSSSRAAAGQQGQQWPHH